MVAKSLFFYRFVAKFGQKVPIAAKLEGALSKALVVGTLKKGFFCGFPNFGSCFIYFVTKIID